MEKSKELNDLLTTGVIVEISNKLVGVVVGDIILYNKGYDPLDRVINLTKNKDSDYYINKIYSPNKKCCKLKGLLDNSDSDIIWERNNKPNRLTKEEFDELPLGAKIIGINESKNMEELEFMKVKDYFLENAVLCLSNYKTYEIVENSSVAYYLKEEYEEYKKSWQIIKINI